MRKSAVVISTALLFAGNMFSAQKWEQGISSAFKGAEMQNQALGTILLILLGIITVGFLIFAFANYYYSTAGEEKYILNYVKKLQKDQAPALQKAVSLFSEHRETEIPALFLSILRNAKRLSDIQLLIPFQYHEKPVLLSISAHATFESLRMPYFDHSFYRPDHETLDWINASLHGKSNGFRLVKEINEIHVICVIESGGKRFAVVFIRDQNA